MIIWTILSFYKEKKLYEKIKGSNSGDGSLALLDCCFDHWHCCLVYFQPYFRN